jgi:Cytochrome c7 and related cytochrome c
VTVTRRRLVRGLILVAICLTAAAGTAEAQLGALVSPGPLSRAHAALEGVKNCEKCHEAGRRVTAARCLVCHQPIARRIAEKRGVHRNVTTDCVTCHVEHAGLDGELRPFNTKTFDHAAETGFALDGKHAGVAATCTACHKTRSFLTVSASCSSCHADVHKGALGNACQRCHSTAVAFKDAAASFDHATTKFPLSGAHRTVACAKCHTSATFTAVTFGSCADCHQSPHPPAMSRTCTTCHTTSTWKTRTFDHSKTAFPLVGRHATVDCDACHKVSPLKVKPPSSTCAACHADPHHGEFTQDCKACHSEKGFAGAAFDHARVTGFGLADGHGGLACQACHTGVSAAGVPLARQTADFRGLNTACATCHEDPHRSELGPSCDTCHTVRTFDVTSFVHPRAQALFAGRHAALACDACHKPAAAAATPAPAARGDGRPPPLVRAKPLDIRFTTTPTTCVSCHRDVHLGQVGTSCQTCHSVNAVRFAPDRFSHDATPFHLTGAHATVACVACHKTETAAFPASRGMAVRLAGLGTTCQSCHADPHLGQVGQACEACHTTRMFDVTRYAHRNPPRDFFVGRHLAAACADCHKKTTGDFPAGHGTAVQFTIGTACVSCHTDPHHGALGEDCGRCHTPEPLQPSHARFAPPASPTPAVFPSRVGA